MTEVTSAASLLRTVVGFVTGVAATAVAFAAGSVVLYAIAWGLFGSTVLLGTGLLLPMAVVGLMLGGSNAMRARRLDYRRLAVELVLAVALAAGLITALLALPDPSQGGV